MNFQLELGGTFPSFSDTSLCGYFVFLTFVHILVSFSVRFFLCLFIHCLPIPNRIFLKIIQKPQEYGILKFVELTFHSHPKILLVAFQKTSEFAQSGLS